MPAGLAFEFITEGQIGRVDFGRGTADGIGAAAAAFSDRALVVVGQDPARQAPRIDRLREAGVTFEILHVPSEPTVDLVRQATLLARSQQVGVVVGIGGGSALDAAKAIAILATHPGDVLDYLEVIGAGKTLDREGLPMIAVPTTAGTGTEVTRNAVLASPEHGVKVSLRSPRLLPRLAIVDPDLSSAMPPDLTARVGCDALTQLIEPFVSTRANPLTDAVCREGLRRAATALRTAVHQGSDSNARESMAAAAMLSGLALANAGLGVVHGLAGPIGGVLSAPHGAICAALLPYAMEVNLRALGSRSPEAEALDRYAELGILLTGRSDAAADDAVAWVTALVADVGIPRLSAFGLSTQMVPMIVQRATVASSTRTNPVVLSEVELAEIIDRAM
jgi:alcohol dehydrogenase class IV